MLYTVVMKRQLFGIFAHPDDEAFGPAGTLFREAHDGTEVHLICVTDGDAGINCDDCTDLGTVRLDEWRASGKLIGTASMKALHYSDSKLCNDLFHQISGEISKYVHETLDGATEKTEVEFVTFDRNGISGHLDHIAVSLMTSFVYSKLREQPPAHCQVGRLRYFCLDYDNHPKCDTSWIFMPAGRPASQIDEIIELSDDEFAHKKEIMGAHYSQRGDMHHLLDRYGDSLQREYFWFEP